MSESRRQKKVASLIKEALSRLLIEVIQDSGSGLITITRVEMTPDLRVAYIYLSVFGQGEDEAVLEVFQTGYKLNGRVIRPAKVVVNKVPSPAEEITDENIEEDNIETQENNIQ